MGTLGKRKLSQQHEADHDSVSIGDNITLGSHNYLGNFINTTINSHPQQEPCHVWALPRRSQCNFVGRKDILERLAVALSPEQSRNGAEAERRCVVISGMGGSGKSEVCIKFAEENRDRFWGVFWLELHTEASKIQSCNRIAEQCGITKPTLDNVISYLARHDEPWLLIIDNADDPNCDYNACFPSCRHGLVLLTTRDKSIADDYQTIAHEELRSLEAVEARELFLKSSRKPFSKRQDQITAADEIVSLLGYHTLAIIQAGAYVRDRKTLALEDYPKLFNEHRREMLEYYWKQRVSTYASVYATFEVSAKLLQASDETEDQDALHMLGNLAFMHYNGLSEHLFSSALGLVDRIRERDCEEGWSRFEQSQSLIKRLPKFMEQENKTTNSDSRQQRAISRLASLSLIILQDEDSHTTFSLHPLISGWIYERQEVGELQQHWAETASLLVLSVTRAHIRWTMPAEWLAQVQVCARLGQNPNLSRTHDPDIASMFYWLACVLLGHSSDPRWVIPTTSQHYSRAKRGPHLQKIQNPKEREDNDKMRLQQPLKAEQILAMIPYDPARLNHAWLLAMLNLEDKGSPQASAWLDLLFALHKSALIDTHSVHNIRRLAFHAICLAERNLTGARQILSQAITMKAQLRPDTYLRRKRAAFGRAVELAGEGKVPRAMSVINQAWFMEVSLPPESHPVRLDLERLFAMAYLKTGKSIEAFEAFSRIVDVEKRMPVEAQLDRLDSMSGLRKALKALGNREAVVRILEQEFSLVEQIFPKTHPRRCRVQFTLGVNRLVKNGQSTLTYDPTDNGIIQIYKELQRLCTDIPDHLLAKPISSQLSAEAGQAVESHQNGDYERGLDIFAKAVDCLEKAVEELSNAT